MAKPLNPVAPIVSLPKVTPPRQTHAAPAAIRRSKASRVRMAVRTQLARSHRRRRELAYASSMLRRRLRDLRSHVRMRLREMSRSITVVKATSPRTVPAWSAPVPAPPVAAAPLSLGTPMLSAKEFGKCVEIS